MNYIDLYLILSNYVNSSSTPPGSTSYFSENRSRGSDRSINQASAVFVCSRLFPIIPVFCPNSVQKFAEIISNEINY